MRDTLMGWIARELEQAQSRGVIKTMGGNGLSQLSLHLRGKMSGFHNEFGALLLPPALVLHAA